MENEQKPPSPPRKPPLTNYARYSAMGFQMIAIIIAGTYGGMQLDKKLQWSKFPVFTIVLSLLSVAGAVYFVVKDLLKK